MYVTISCGNTSRLTVGRYCIYGRLGVYLYIYMLVVSLPISTTSTLPVYIVYSTVTDRVYVSMYSCLGTITTGDMLLVPGSTSPYLYH